jgi:hypothetical protein
MDKGTCIGWISNIVCRIVACLLSRLVLGIFEARCEIQYWASSLGTGFLPIVREDAIAAE